MTDFTLYIPSYNDSELVAQTLASSLDWNVVISDNCSDERHRKALAAMAGAHVQVIHQTRQLGRVGNWRFCLEHFVNSDAQWFKLLGAGDRHAPGALSALRHIAAGLPDARSLIGAVEMIDGSERRLWKMGDKDAIECAAPAVALRNAAQHGNIFFGLNAHAVHRDALAGGFDLAEGLMSYCADFLFAVQVARRVDTYFLPVTVAQMVIEHRKTYSAKRNSLEALLEEMLVRHRAAEWLAEATGDTLERDQLIKELGLWLESQLAQRHRQASAE